MNSAITVTALAEMLGVNRRRIAKWRAAEAAPDGTDIDQWRAWLQRTGRTTLAGRLDQAPGTLAEAAREMPAGITAETTVRQPAGHTDDTLVKPSADAAQIEWDRYWKAYANRERALTAERERQQLDRVLIHVDEVKALLTAQASAQVAALGDAVWLAIRPLLDGVTDSLRRSLRTAHDQAVLDIRTRLAQIVAEHMRQAVASPPQS